VSAARTGTLPQAKTSSRTAACWQREVIGMRLVCQILCPGHESLVSVEDESVRAGTGGILVSGALVS
jgi:hypothetical protein